jgi:hypothetical protein
MNVKVIKKIARQQRIENERLIGRSRSKSWGGKPTPKQDRRNWRKDSGA